MHQRAKSKVGNSPSYEIIVVTLLYLF